MMRRVCSGSAWTAPSAVRAAGPRPGERTLRGVRRSATIACAPQGNLPAGGPLRVAVAGGGLAGLATAHALLSLGAVLQRDVQVRVWDPAGAGGAGASRAAAGLLHPLTPRGTPAFRGLEGMAATRTLLARAGDALGRPCHADVPVVRLALGDQPDKDAKLRKQGAGDDAREWWDAGRLHAEAPLAGPAGCEGALAVPGAAVDMGAYLEGLSLACAHDFPAGSYTLERAPLPAEAILTRDGYTAVVYCTGASAAGLQGLPCALTPSPGVNVVFAPPPAGAGPALPVLPVTLALIAGKYLVPLPGGAALGGALQVPRDADGAAFAPLLDHLAAGCPARADPVAVDARAAADALLGTTLGRIYPPLAGAAPVEARAAVRVASPPGPGGRLLPIAVRLPADGPALARWALVGLGARGLLYHALVAAHLADALVAGDPGRVPREFGCGRDA